MSKESKNNKQVIVNKDQKKCKCNTGEIIGAQGGCGICNPVFMPTPIDRCKHGVHGKDCFECYPTPTDWEKEFDESFPCGMIDETIIKSFIRAEKEKSYNEGFMQAFNEGKEMRLKLIEEIIKEVEGTKDHYKKLHDESMPNNTLIGYHADSCIRTCSEILSKLKEKLTKPQ